MDGKTPVETLLIEYLPSINYTFYATLEIHETLKSVAHAGNTAYYINARNKWKQMRLVLAIVRIVDDTIEIVDVYDLA